MKQEDLILQVKLFDDSEAYKLLYEEFFPMINSIIKGLDLKRGDFQISIDDLYQEASLGLYDAIKKYQDSEYAKFSTFAYVVIKRRINRQFYKSINHYKKEYTSYDRLLYADHASFMASAIAEKEAEYAKQEKVDAIYQSKFVTLEDKEILALRLQNFSYKEIAHKLHISAKRVDNRLTRLKKYFRELYNSNNDDII